MRSAAMRYALLLLPLLFMPISQPSMATTVCSVGDSITYGAKRLRTNLYNAHNDWQYIGNNYDGRWFHDGIPGDSSADVVSRLDNIPPCDIAFVLIGTNDFGSGIYSINETISNIQTIVDTLSGRGTAVYVETLLPRFDFLELNTWNIAINKKITEKITGATILDTYKSLANSNYPLVYLLYDGLHPSWLGYDEMAEYINPLIP